MSCRELSIVFRRLLSARAFRCGYLEQHWDGYGRHGRDGRLEAREDGEDGTAHHMSCHVMQFGVRESSGHLGQQFGRDDPGGNNGRGGSGVGRRGEDGHGDGDGDERPRNRGRAVATDSRELETGVGCRGPAVGRDTVVVGRTEKWDEGCGR